MATRVGPASVSYGIGVQNRYSAFLDDEDALNGSPAATIVAKRVEHTASKQKSPAIGVQNSVKLNNNNQLAGKSNGRVCVNSSKQEQQQKSGHPGPDLPRRVDGKRQRAGQQQSVNHSVQASKQQTANKQGNSNQESIANNRFVRTQQNSDNHHQSNVSHQQNFQNKENSEAGQQRGKFMRNSNNNNNQRTGNRRQFYNDDKKANHQIEDGQASSFGNNIGTQSNEDEKHRRQQKRALDLKHKDLDKRETRRQQIVAAEPSNVSGQAAPGENNLVPKAQKNRRQVSDGQQNQDDANRGFGRGPGNGGRGRGRRTEQSGLETNGERRDGQQASRNPRGTDRPQRNRNGLGTGSRGSRGDDQGKFNRDSERQKPIPNFSDKLDFPSLAS